MLKYITLGIENKEYYNYDGKPLPIRPLSTYELDKALECTVEGISSSIFNSVIDLKLDILKKNDIKLNKSNYKDFLTYYNEIDYWTVYYAMKDFQDVKFSMPDFEGQFKKFDDWDPEKPNGYYVVKKMTHVHDIATHVMSMTNQSTKTLMEFLKNGEGKLLATMVHRFHVPLTDKAWKLTPLQTSFIYYSRPDAPEYIEDEKDLPGITGGTLEEVSKQLREMGLG